MAPSVVTRREVYTGNTAPLPVRRKVAGLLTIPGHILQKKRPSATTFFMLVSQVSGAGAGQKKPFLRVNHLKQEENIEKHPSHEGGI